MREKYCLGDLDMNREVLEYVNGSVGNPVQGFAGVLYVIIYHW
jgi:hypothetical protein